MGIRFYCPNGHRLNVKDFLAGKRGICPHCEVRFRIPPASEIPKGSPRIKPGSVAEAVPASSRRRSNSSVVQTATIEKPLTSVQADSEEKIHSDHTDPIDEAPDSVWYVRPPSGGQFGPAKGEVVRRWISEGRVSVDSLVWREGWSDWKLAGPIFPSLAGLNAHPAPVESETAQVVVTDEPEPESTPLPSLPTPAKQSRPWKSALAVVGLIMLIVVLGIGLVVVLVAKS